MKGKKSAPSKPKTTGKPTSTAKPKAKSQQVAFGGLPKQRG